MRSVLGLALVLAILALLTRLGLDRPRADAVHGGADRALGVVVGARGRLLPAARLGPGREWIAASVRLGERTFPAPEGLDGLFAVTLDLSLDQARARAFPAADPGSAAALRRAVEAAGESVLLTLATQGDLAGLARDELDAALARLGASTRLGRSAPESLALIALHTADGWVTLAEAHSPDSGVAASFLLGTDLERYAGFRGDLVTVRDPPEAVVFLVDELPWAADPGRAAVERVDPALNGRAMPSLRQPARTPLVWDDVPVGPGSGFLAWLGVEEGQPAQEFQVRVEGQPVVRRVVAPGAPWRTELVDLRAFAGQRVRLELRLEPVAASPGAGAGLWGRPMLVRGFERSPLTAWAEAR